MIVKPEWLKSPKFCAEALRQLVRKNVALNVAGQELYSEDESAVFLAAADILAGGHQAVWDAAVEYAGEAPGPSTLAVNMTPRASASLRGEPAPTDEALRKMWLAAGGNFHGPLVETGCMSEAKLLPFLRGLLAPGQSSEDGK